MKKSLVLSLVAAGIMLAIPSASFAQDPLPEAAPAAVPEVAAPAAAGAIVDNTDTAMAEKTAAAAQKSGESVFWTVLTGSGTLGFLLWMALFSAGGFYIYLVVQLSILIRPSKIMPETLTNNVEAAMKEGDVVKALQFCENDPTPMASILSAGFSHVEEGFEVIQEAISTAADLEVERMNQRLTWLSVDANIAPMLGLLGTVQGMIMAFSNLAGGSPDVGLLAVNISQALWTTAGGLCVAIPAVFTYYAFRNKANRIVLRMEAITMELVKDLRNVEVVTD